MSTVASKLRTSAAVAAKSALVIGVTIVAMFAVTAVIHRLSAGRWSTDWLVAIKFVVVFSTGWFAIMLPYTFFKLRANEPADEILSEEPPAGSRLKDPIPGFVAMEYFWLIMNRTYVVAIAAEGLYGWKACGAVDNSNPAFFAPYERLVQDPDLMTDIEAVRKLSALDGGFFIPRSDIASVETVYGRKWGMGGIPHSGRIKIRLASGKSREFILLGSVSADTVQQNIESGVATANANWD